MTPPHPSVLLFTDADVFAGTERHILALARGLRDRGLRVSVACPEPSLLGEKLAAEGIAHVVVQKRGLYDRAAVRTLRGLLREGCVDVVHAHNGRTTLTAALAVSSAGRGACVATQHFITPNHAGHRGLKRWITAAVHRWVNRRVHAQIAISEAVRRAALLRGDVDPARLHLVHNGIADPALGGLRSPFEVRAEFGVPRDAPLVVCAARFEAEKGLADLIRAMALVHESSPACACVVAGEGAERGALERLRRELRLENVVQLPGYRADAPSLIRAADVFALPSPAEPFGLAILEAMALGKPVVAARAGGPMEIVVEGETGLLIPPGDPRALADAILRLVGSPTDRAAMGRLGRERFESRFTAARMAEEVSEVYRRAILAASPGTPAT
jgi:glycosyltransferase involved in cell wall biosynthesis